MSIPFNSASLLICPLPFHPPPGKRGNRRKFSWWKLYCDTVSHTEHSLAHISLLAESHWSGLKSLVSATLSMLALTMIPLGCPVVAPCHGDPPAVGLQDQLLRVLQKITDGVDVTVSQLSPGSGAEWLQGWSVFQFSPVLTCAELSGIVVTSSPYAVRNKGQDWFSCFHVPRVSSPTPIPARPALLCCPGEVKRALSRVLQLVRVMDSSPALKTSGSALSSATGCEGRGWG